MSFAQQIFGAKPTVPKLPSLTLEAEQAKAIQGNLQALPQAEQLTAQANQFSREQITQMLQAAIPGYGAMTDQASQNIQAELRGEIPEDVSRAVQQSAAARALSTGTQGSGMARNLVARDLGLTSLALTQQGLSSAQSWIKMADAMYSPSMMNVSSMFVSPMQQAGFDVAEREAQFQRQWMQSQISAMPDPVMSGIYNDIYGLVQAYLGGSGGTGRSSSMFSSGGGGGGGGGGMGGYSSMMGMAAGGGGMGAGGMAIPAI